jgi:hypothetical protein
VLSFINLPLLSCLFLSFLFLSFLFLSFLFLSFKMSLSINLITKESWVHTGLSELNREKAILLRRLRDIESIQSDKFLEELGGPTWERRKSRREAERRTGDVIIPNGPWNNDLDEYHGTQEYAVKLPAILQSKGYRAYACRNFWTWTWNGYVSIPNTHPFFENVTDFDSYYDCFNCGVSVPPQEVTFIKNGTFGWDHARSDECCPIPRNKTEPRMIGYINFEGISRECVEFATWLESQEHMKISKPSCTCGKCAGCLWDHSNDCSGMIDCDCRKCKPCYERYRLPSGETTCRCDPQSCKCYGCFGCVTTAEKITQEVDSMISAVRASSSFNSIVSSSPTHNTDDINYPWITVRSKRRSKRV